MSEVNGDIIDHENEVNERTSLLVGDEMTYSPSPLVSRGRSFSTPEIFDSINSLRHRARSNTVSSIVSNSVEIVRQHVDKKKFAYLIVVSLFIYLSFVAAFAPRTSLSRDFRRWHNSRLTTSEIYRIYLDILQEENFAHKHLKEYGQIDNGDESLEYTTKEFRKLGFEPKIEKYYPWVTLPEETAVQLIKNETFVWNATLSEDCLSEYNKSSCKKIPTGYHAYSPNGEVRNQFVFCNYGTLEDYRTLINNNIAIEGKIHILRYGDLSTGIKIKNAELYGASSVILYNDPYDDGFVTEKNGFKPYPNGPARNPSSIERDSVEYSFDSPGDPTTPNFPSKSRDLERLSPVGKIPRIPSIPMSAKEINPILMELNGKGIRLGKGNIDNFDYYSGPSDANVQVNLISKQNNSVIEIADIVTEIPGIFSNGDIIIGSHRDVWTPLGGAANPNSGSAILLEIARGFSKLKKTGWKPLRTIKLISWDAEMYGLIGSTEYVEEHSTNLKGNALVYINLDTAISGSEFHCKGNKLLEEAIYRAAKYTSFKGKEDWTLFEEWEKSSSLEIEPIGGVSSSTSFQSYLGISSVEFQFKNNKRTDAIHHANSIFDSQEWMEKYIDPNYKLHNTLATFTGLFSLMVSEKEVNFFTVYPYMNQIYKRMIDLNRMVKSIFPHDDELHQHAQAVLSVIDLTTSQDSVLFDKKVEKIYKECFQDMPIWYGFKKLGLFINLQRMNRKLKHFDRIFVIQNGLRDREFMKHSIFAPNKYNGVDADVIPGLHEALIDMDRAAVIEALNILQSQFEKVRDLLH